MGQPFCAAEGGYGADDATEGADHELCDAGWPYDACDIAPYCCGWCWCWLTAATAGTAAKPFSPLWKSSDHAGPFGLADELAKSSESPVSWCFLYAPAAPSNPLGDELPMRPVPEARELRRLRQKKKPPTMSATATSAMMMPAMAPPEIPLDVESCFDAAALADADEAGAEPERDDEDGGDEDEAPRAVVELERAAAAEARARLRLSRAALCAARTLERDEREAAMRACKTKGQHSATRRKGVL